MADCTKRLIDLTPGDAVHCFWNASDWQIIDNNVSRMWSGFTSTTIGEWLEIIFALAMMPALIMSYILPCVLVGIVARRVKGQTEYVETQSGNNLRTFSVVYLVVVGLTMMMAFSNDSFMPYQAGWLLFVALVSFAVPKSFWGDLRFKARPSAPRR